jgi:23S rRNA (cytidine1920-2'-O)/16S rRNA (cytidine1409-2'-O)-methyltransferase
VLVSGSLATKPERLVDGAEPIEMVGPSRRFVSRGGEKLDGAIDEFAIDVQGAFCVDIGASTGGFTDCLLQRGAAGVLAIDVGRGQLDWKLRTDDRVRSMERTDVRDFDATTIGVPDLVVVDVSFISLRTVLPAIAQIARGAPVLALVKPQFEVGAGKVNKGGIVRDPVMQMYAVAEVSAAAQDIGLETIGASPSVIAGAKGNKEVFILLKGKRI